LSGEGLIHQLRLTGVTRAVELLHRAAGENHAGVRPARANRERADFIVVPGTGIGRSVAELGRRVDTSLITLAGSAQTDEFGLVGSILGLDEPLAVPAVALVNAAG